MADKAYLATIDKMLTKALGDRSERISQEALDKFADFEDGGRLDRYMLADRYYKGEQETKLTDRLKQYLENSRLRYVENICAVVADSYAERLLIIGVTTSEDKPTPKPEPTLPGAPPAPTPPETQDLSDWIWERVWDGSEGDERQIDLHHDVARRGDGFLIVDYDTDRLRPRLVRQLPDQCRVIYSNGTKKLGIKKWYTDDAGPTNPDGRKVCRMNLYYPDRIEKWMKLHSDKGANASSGGGWIEWLDDGETIWPTPWIGRDDKPLGIPVFHLANKRDDSGYGEYEHRVIVPLQDRLNKELIDLSAILDGQGWPQRYATGVESTADLKSVPGEIWNTGNENAKFGQFEAAAPDGALKSIESTIQRVVKLSRTPQYMLELTGGTPSGEALKTSERGLVSKIEGRQPSLGNQWTEALRMGVLVALTFGGTSDEEQPPVPIATARMCSINVTWKDARTFDEASHLQALQIMQTLGIPDEILWGMMEGIDVDQVKQMKVASDVSNAALLVASFNRGGQSNPAEPGQTLPPAPGGTPVALLAPKPGPIA